MKKEETSLQNEIITALCLNGCVARNHTVGNFYTDYGSRVQVGTKGESDIMGHRISDGKAFYIEVKLPGEEPREEQKKFLDAMVFSAVSKIVVKVSISLSILAIMISAHSSFEKI